MKKTILILILALIGFASCKKDVTTSIPVVQPVTNNPAAVHNYQVYIESNYSGPVAHQFYSYYIAGWSTNWELLNGMYDQHCTSYHLDTTFNNHMVHTYNFTAIDSNVAYVTFQNTFTNGYNDTTELKFIKNNVVIWDTTITNGGNLNVNIRD